MPGHRTGDGVTPEWLGVEHEGAQAPAARLAGGKSAEIRPAAAASLGTNERVPDTPEHTPRVQGRVSPNIPGKKGQPQVQGSCHP